MRREVLAEFCGSAILLAVITGSGIMGEALSPGNGAVALLGNSLATGAALYVLIVLIAPLSGAHFNPLVSLAAFAAGELRAATLLVYTLAQVIGAFAGVWLTHLYFELPVLQTSLKARDSLGMFVSEFVATLMLLVLIRVGQRTARDKLPALIALTVLAGYWFTASTFFVNPAVSLARAATNTFVGIAPHSLPGFLAAQLLAAGLVAWYLARSRQRSPR
jgi:glycerol uptake facilitator-like aquaporin